MNRINLSKSKMIMSCVIFLLAFSFAYTARTNAHTIEHQSFYFISQGVFNHLEYWMYGRETSGNAGTIKYSSPEHPNTNLLWFKLSNNDSGRGRYYFRHLGDPIDVHNVQVLLQAQKDVSETDDVWAKLYVQEADYSWHYLGSCTYDWDPFPVYWNAGSCAFSTDQADGYRGIVIKTNGSLLVDFFWVWVE